MDFQQMGFYEDKIISAVKDGEDEEKIRIWYFSKFRYSKDNFIKHLKE